MHLYEIPLCNDNPCFLSSHMFYNLFEKNLICEIILHCGSRFPKQSQKFLQESNIHFEYYLCSGFMMLWVNAWYLRIPCLDTNGQLLIEQSTLTPINKMAMTSSAKLQLMHCLMCIRLDFWGSQIAHGILGTLEHDINFGTNPNNLSFKKISCVPHGIRISFGKKSWVQILPYIYFPNWVSSHASLERGFHDLFTKILLHIYLPNLVTPHASLKDVSLIYLLMGMGHM